MAPAALYAGCKHNGCAQGTGKALVLEGKVVYKQPGALEGPAPRHAAQLTITLTLNSKISEMKNSSVSGLSLL